MSLEIIRIAVYWIPPDNLGQVMKRTWEGKFNEDRACKLVFRHCGDCRIWGPHATLLDAVTIMKNKRAEFIKAISEVLREFLPIRLSNPMVKDWGWGNLIILRWDDNEQRASLKDLRKELMAKAKDFIVVEQVSWEAINELERLINVIGNQVNSDLKVALKKLKGQIRLGPLRLPHAPNIPLDWYVQSLSFGRNIIDGELPFPPSPHISVATAVHADEEFQMTSREVATYINTNLYKADGWKDVLGRNINHVIDSACIVEPAPLSVEPMEVVVVDRVSGKLRTEMRQPWVKKELLPI